VDAALFLELLLSGEGRLVHGNGPGYGHREQDKAPDVKKKYSTYVYLNTDILQKFFQ
jgi:hypothetical protein